MGTPEDVAAEEHFTPLGMCGRCYDEVDELFPANCTEKPEKLLGQPLGQYHCPDCGAMVIAGVPHPELCKRCLDRKHPAFDTFSEEEQPTQERKIQFWEGYGYTGKLESIQPVDGQEEGKLVYANPLIDLNSLFRYAVPKYIDEIKAGVSANYIGNAYARLFERWQKQLFLSNWEDPALALFCVLEKERKPDANTH